MKKATAILIFAALMTACGSPSNEQATVTDTVKVLGNGVDSSVILPALTDSAKALDSAEVGNGVENHSKIEN